MIIELGLSLLYVVVLVAACLIALWTVQLINVRAQKTHTHNLFARHSAVMLFTLLVYIGIALSPSDQFAEIFGRLRFIGIALLPPLWLRFTLMYSGALPQRQRTISLLIAYLIPLISIALALFAPYSWWFQKWEMRMYGVINVEVVTYGWYYYIHTLNSYVQMIVTIYILFRVSVQSMPPFRSQAFMIVCGIIAGGVINIASLLRREDTATLNFTALSFCLMVSVYAYAMLRYSFLHIVPIANETIINNLDTAVLVLDTQNAIVTLNPAARKTLALGDAHVSGRLLIDVYPAFHQFGDEYTDAYDLETELAFIGRIFEVRIAPLYYSKNDRRLVGRTITWRDVTERKRAERERERLITDLEAYSHTVAHDLKNPLHTMMSLNQLIGMDLHNVQPHIRHYLDLQMQSGLRMKNIIQDLLFLAQVRGQAQLVLEVVSLKGTLSKAMIQLESEIRTREAVIEVPETLPDVTGIESWIEQVWANYLSNALKYGGIPPVIRITTQPVEKGLIRCNIQDNGAGLTEEQRAKLFQQFVRLEPDRAAGTGLGLSIVQRIMERLGGTVGVESESGGGSTFYFTLPSP